MMVTASWASAKLNVAVTVLTILVALVCCKPASADMLPIGAEQDNWSDMVMNNTTISYDGTTLSISAGSAATQIEIGGEFGPSNPGNHYGTGGTLGGLGGGSPVFTSLDLSGVDVNSSGIVTDGGSVTVTYTAPPAGTFVGDLSDDYGLIVGDTLLEGNVLEVLLGATGSQTLDVLFSITGGALQTGTNSEPSLAGVPYATSNLGLLRIAGGSPGLPADWSGLFSASGATMDVFGTPEPSSAVLWMIGLSLMASSRPSRQRARKL